MDSIKTSLAQLKEAIREELTDLRQLKGKPLSEFKSIFSLEGEIEIFFNEYNIVMIDPETYEQVKTYLSANSLVISVNVPEHNTYLWVHQYFNDRIFNDYLK